MNGKTHIEWDQRNRNKSGTRSEGKNKQKMQRKQIIKNVDEKNGKRHSFSPSSYLFIMFPSWSLMLLGGERPGEYKVSFPRTQYTTTWPWLEPRLLHPRSSTVNTRPLTYPIHWDWHMEDKNSYKYLFTRSYTKNSLRTRSYLCPACISNKTCLQT